MSVLKPYIQASARKYDLEPELIAAVIVQESGGYAWAARYEPEFFDRYVLGRQANGSRLLGHVPRRISLATEMKLRATSLGVMQILGQTVREMGFSGESLCELLEPGTNIDWGSKILARNLARTGDVQGALLRYNGGGDPGYARKVLAHIESNKIEELL